MNDVIIDMIRKTILEAIALIFLNILAIIYDAQWLYYAVGVDALMLGVRIGAVFSKKDNEIKKEIEELKEVVMNAVN